MNLETGNPKFDGRYVVYVEGVLGWLEPKIVMWSKNRWHFLHSTEAYPDPVFSWIGPLPIMSKPPVLEYDL